jgi:two-component system nitrogen regulation response regulator GlnG
MDEAHKPLLLIVDDDPLITDTLGYSLGKRFQILTSHSRAHALQLLHQLRTPPDAALIDLGLPPAPHRPDEGFALIADLLAASPETRIVVLSGQNDTANARHARTLGAVEFVAKPCEPGRLASLLERALAVKDHLAGEAASTASALLGNSPAMQLLRAQLRQFGDSPFPVLIEGESGSGKEIVARVGLHLDTARRDKPFFALNCAAIAPTLVEPTLFGYAKGAFTGATTARAGYFEEATDGTLFLDEIGELPLELQAKLLRVLENGEYQRVGETQTRIARARIIAATNRDLRRETRAGRFRTDLYHRLSVFTLNVPPLREMEDDRQLLLDHFRTLYARQLGQPPFAFDAGAGALWNRYSFPGNVRELRNIVIRLIAKHPGQSLGAGELEPELDAQPAAETAPANGLPSDLETATALAAKQLQGLDHFDLDAALQLIERGFIEAALRQSRGNVSQAAKLLGLNRTTLYNRMESKDTQ